jgi:hypothetical protein
MYLHTLCVSYPIVPNRQTDVSREVSKADWTRPTSTFPVVCYCTHVRTYIRTCVYVCMYWRAVHWLIMSGHLMDGWMDEWINEDSSMNCRIVCTYIYMHACTVETKVYPMYLSGTPYPLHWGWLYPHLVGPPPKAFILSFVRSFVHLFIFFCGHITHRVLRVLLRASEDHFLFFESKTCCISFNLVTNSLLHELKHYITIHLSSIYVLPSNRTSLVQ